MNMQCYIDFTENLRELLPGREVMFSCHGSMSACLNPNNTVTRFNPRAQISPNVGNLYKRQDPTQSMKSL